MSNPLPDIHPALINLLGAVIAESPRSARETREILLPNHFADVIQIAVDIGGSLAKVVWFSRGSRGLRESRDSVLGDSGIAGKRESAIPGINTNDNGNGGRLCFAKFETSAIDSCLDFIAQIIAETNGASQTAADRVLKATGGGAHRFETLVRDRLGVTVQKEDEMECLIAGLNFLVKQIPNEVFTYDEKRLPEDPMRFEDTSTSHYPYLLVNIGSGVSIVKVTANDSYERISGTSLGGGTLWGLLSLMTDATTYDDMLELSKEGDNRNVDMLVGDIYGSDYNKIGLKATTIASSFGKVFKAPPEERKAFKSQDISRSLLFMVSNNIGQIAYLNARAHNINRIYFGGCFIRGHPITMNTLSYAINFWSKGQSEAYFLRHEGYLGAMGAFLKYSPASSPSFTENFTIPSKINPSSVNAVGVLERLPSKLSVFPLLSSSSYNPDTMDLTDSHVQKYWIDLLEKNLSGLVEAALEWQWAGGSNTREDAQLRAAQFEKLYRGHLARLRKEPGVYGQLSVRSLLILREQCLHELGFTDIFEGVKRSENEAALTMLPRVLEEIDSTPDELKLRLLLDHALAGNMYDWGSTHMLEMLRKGELDFQSAKDKVTRSETYDNFLSLKARLERGIKYKKAVIFVDNSGADIVLGILPFARYLLQKDIQIVLAANTFPSVNDVTANELRDILTRVAKIDEDGFGRFVRNGRLKTIETGGGSPCLDLRRMSDELCKECVDCDLVILEGMGRAIHTNFHASFQVDSLKIAVFKNVAVAEALNAQMFDGIVIFEAGKRSSVLSF